MPGASLWLVPSPGSKIHTALQDLITTRIPSHFSSLSPPPPNFVPHVTITSDIDLSEVLNLSGGPGRTDPKEWLDTLQLPSRKDVVVRFTGLNVGEKMTQKLTIGVEKSMSPNGDGNGLCELVAVCRIEGVEKVMERRGRDSGEAHDVDAGALPLIDRSHQTAVMDAAKSNAQKWLQESYGPHCSLLYAMTDISSLQKAACEEEVTAAGISLSGEGAMGGWTGGEIWVVPTNKPFEEWMPVAVRQIPN